MQQGLLKMVEHESGECLKALPLPEALALTHVSKFDELKEVGPLEKQSDTGIRRRVQNMYKELLGSANGVWLECIEVDDKEKMYRYFFNTATKQSRFTVPPDFIPKSTIQQSQSVVVRSVTGLQSALFPEATGNISQEGRTLDVVDRRLPPGPIPKSAYL
eukprot:gene31484-6670_t